MKIRIIVYSVLLVILLLICIGVYQYHKEYEPYITIIASVSSIVGVLISIIEIFNVRKTTEAVSQSLEETKKEINDFLYFSEINEMTRLIDEIEAFLNDDHFESAWLKLKELKSNLDKAISETNDKNELYVLSHILKEEAHHIELLENLQKGKVEFNDSIKDEDKKV